LLGLEIFWGLLETPLLLGGEAAGSALSFAKLAEGIATRARKAQGAGDGFDLMMQAALVAKEAQTGIASEETYKNF